MWKFKEFNNIIILMRIFTIEIFDMNNENIFIIESHTFFNFVARLSNLCNVHFSHKTFAEKQTNRHMIESSIFYPVMISDTYTADWQ